MQPGFANFGNRVRDLLCWTDETSFPTSLDGLNQDKNQCCELLLWSPFAFGKWVRIVCWVDGTLFPHEPRWTQLRIKGDEENFKQGFYHVAIKCFCWTGCLSGERRKAESWCWFFVQLNLSHLIYLTGAMLENWKAMFMPWISVNASWGQWHIHLK